VALEQAALADWRRLLAQIAPADFHVAVFGQLPAAQFPLDDYLETRPLEMERLHASLGRRALVEQRLEGAPANSRGSLIRTQDYGKLDAIAFVVPAGVFGKLEKQHCGLRGEGAECSLFVLSLRGFDGNNEIAFMIEPSSWASLVPELLATDINKSLSFWRDVCGFTVLFDRPDEGFAYLDLDGAQIMLDEIGKTRDWVTGPLESPFGRGMNLFVRVVAIEPILASLARAGWALFLDPEQKWYRAGERRAPISGPGPGRLPDSICRRHR
jgi:catechol 2,3-dioxygenase-like lactoylglutathione lyase family enzyme